MESKLTADQKKHLHKEYTNESGEHCRLIVQLRFDDDCRNGHNTFSITGDLFEGKHHSCGCLHDEISKVFPELQKYIKWHLCSTDGPLHYIANTCYWARKRHSGDGKEEGPDLDIARKTAIWFDATDADLLSPGLEDKLTARLPKLLEEFKAAMEELGFVW